MGVLADLNPIDNPQAWDTISVGGVTSPGVIPKGGVSGFKREHEWDVKKGKGAAGATLTYVQRPPAKGSIKFYLVTPQHFSDWETFALQFKYDPTKKNPQAVDVFHPALAQIDVKSCVTTALGTVQAEGDEGLYAVTVELEEYFPPPKKSAVGTPSTSQANTNPNANVPPSAQDAQQAEIAALMAQASKP